MDRRLKYIIYVGFAVIFSLLLATPASALNYDIGRKSSGGGNADWYLYDSGASVKISDTKYLDYLHLILDGNESTGLDHKFGSGSSGFNVNIEFTSPLFVNNITVKPKYNGSASSYLLSVANDNFGAYLATSETTEKKYSLNVIIDSMQFTIDNGGTDHFYFNDIIIEYTPLLNDLSGVVETLEILIDNIENINNNYNSIKNELETINNYIFDADSQLLENITRLWNSFSMLNQSINFLSQQLQQLNVSVYKNITGLENNVVSINQEISNLHELIKNLIEDDDNDDDALEDINDRLNDTGDDIDNLYENVTLIRKNILEGSGGDNTLIDRIFQLENENTILKQELENLTKRIDNIKKTEKDTLIEDDGGNDAIMYSALGFGLIAIIIAVISMLIKRREPEGDAGEDEGVEEQGPAEPQVQAITQFPMAQPPPAAAEIPVAKAAAVVKPAEAKKV